ncbi:hypothetical protein FMUND_14673 [Fusarium mundagurra]|uniref:Uncharacterized protein n=1 Tax=Fusarium mundagurra TaxID=1567541 RepID=A0A8H5XTM6_9HYPO|nr:hypothetical protein FMUND_14673 [Fusarium mundagurra]
MDSNLQLYRSTLHLGPKDHRQRLQHLPKAELIRVKTLVEKEQWTQRLEKLVAGRDLVELALTIPSEIEENPPLQKALLGRACYPDDENSMVRRITKSLSKHGESLINTVASFDGSAYPAITKDAWLLVYCDLCYIDGNNMTLHEVYMSRLQEEELQTRTEQAREVVRSNIMKLARRNAKWMIPALEQLSDDELSQSEYDFSDTLHKIWKQVSHPPPNWVQHILDAQHPWGFTYYKTQQVEGMYGHTWKDTWIKIINMPQLSWPSIHCQGRADEFMALKTEDWATPPTYEGSAEEDAFHKHFREHRKSLSSPAILQNTFIVIPIELIPNDPEDEELDPCWVWAYDADWDSTSEETICNGEKYQGRVKVPIVALEGWFYAARWEGGGVNLRDMWLKAQKQQDKMWICDSKELEDWDHEPYV